MTHMKKAISGHNSGNDPQGQKFVEIIIQGIGMNW